MKAARSKRQDKDAKKLSKVNINRKKCKKLWEKVKNSDKVKNSAVDFSFTAITVLAIGVTLTTTSYWNWLENLFTHLGIILALYLAARALTGRLRILSADESHFKHEPVNIILCATLLVVSGTLLSISEFGLHGDYNRYICYRVIAPCATVLGFANASLGLARSTRLSNFIFCVLNVVACVTGTIVAWVDYAPRSIVMDSYFYTLFENNKIFLDLSTTVPMTLRLLCPMVNFVTTLFISVLLAFSVISFKRKEQKTKAVYKKVNFPKLLVGIFGMILLLVTFYKIWNISNALFMPGPLDYLEQTISALAVLNYNMAGLTSLMAASYLDMRCSGRLETMVLTTFSSAAMTTDYFALSQYNPRNSLNHLDENFKAFKGCPNDNGSAYCYKVKRMSNYGKNEECLPLFKVCDGIIDIKKPIAIIQGLNCDTFNDTLVAHETRPRHNYENMYNDEWIKIAADEAFCRSHFEPFINSWMMCSFISMALCSLIILMAAFIPSQDEIKVAGKLKINDSHNPEIESTLALGNVSRGGESIVEQAGVDEEL